MANNTLNTLLKDYEQKRYKAELICEAKKMDFYNSNPELAELNSKLGNLAIRISKAVLQNDNELENKLCLEFDKLKQKKDSLLKNLEIPKRSIRT